MSKMKFEEAQRSRLSPDWKNIDHIILYGRGNIAQVCFEKIHRDFSVDMVMDRAAGAETEWQGIPLYMPEQGLVERDGQKIIVMTGERAYQGIADFLRKQGLVEYRDFCSVEYFFTWWYWTERKENVVTELHMVLTMRCTLRCQNCNMLVPYYEKPMTFSRTQLKEELQLLFTYVDYLGCLTLLGGEPFLYEELAPLLDTLRKKYRDRIGTIKLITNGTLLPDAQLLTALKEANVWISVSDYTHIVPYKKRLDAFIMCLREHGIRTTTVAMKEWRDFGFPDHPFHFADQDVSAHRRACAPSCHGYNEGKIFYCHITWSADKIGRCVLKPGDFVDLHMLNREKRHEIALHLLGETLPPPISPMPKRCGIVSLCRVCGGFGEDNTHAAIAGKQVTR